MRPAGTCWTHIYLFATIIVAAHAQHIYTIEDPSWIHGYGYIHLTNASRARINGFLIAPLFAALPHSSHMAQKYGRAAVRIENEKPFVWQNPSTAVFVDAVYALIPSRMQYY